MGTLIQIFNFGFVLEITKEPPPPPPKKKIKVERRTFKTFSAFEKKNFSFGEGCVVLMVTSCVKCWKFLPQ
jgi:hypothetical protein